MLHLAAVKTLRSAAIIALFLGSFALTGSHGAYAQSAKKPKGISLAPFLGKDFAAYEKVLGKAVRTKTGMRRNETTEYPYESRYYKVAGFRSVKLQTTSPDQPRDYVTEIELLFPKGTLKSREAALARVGLPTTVEANGDKGDFSLTSKAGRMTGGWWSPNDPNHNADVLYLYPKPLAKKNGSAAQPTALPSLGATSKTPNLFALQGKSLVEYEAVLGKPRLVEPDNGSDFNGKTRERRFYKVGGLTRVVLYMADRPEPVVSTVEVQFPKATVASWQDALTIIGYSADGVTPVSYPNGYTLLKNIPGLLKNGQEWIADGAGEYVGENAARNTSGSHRLSLYQDLRGN